MHHGWTAPKWWRQSANFHFESTVGLWHRWVRARCWSNRPDKINANYSSHCCISNWICRRWELWTKGKMILLATEHKMKWRYLTIRWQIEHRLNNQLGVIGMAGVTPIICNSGDLSESKHILISSPSLIQAFASTKIPHAREQVAPRRTFCTIANDSVQGMELKTALCSHW